MAKKRKLENKSGSAAAKDTEQATEHHREEQEVEQIQYSGGEEVDEDVEAQDPEVEEEDEEDVNLWQSKTKENAESVANASNSEATVAPSSGNADGDADEEEDEDGEEEDEDEDGEEESISKLIEPFSKEQIIDLLREAAENHPDVQERIRKLADTELVHRKIFVHGLGWDTNAEVLMNTFQEYGEIEDCNAVCDKITGKSKGYGFILFKHRSGARKALSEPQKRIGNRMTACQLASAGPIPAPAPLQPAVPVSEYTQRKIYVSNVSADIDPQKLLSFFAKYGEIEEGPLGLDKQTGKPKGFTLFVYKSAESAKKALEEPHKNFEGHILHCQKAVDGPKPNKPYYQQQYPQQQHGVGRGSHFQRSGNSSVMGAIGNHGSAVGGAGGHLMAPSQPGISFNQGSSQALNPVLGQAITALLATQGGAGLGLTNLLGALGSSGVGAGVNQPMVNSAMQGGYGNQSVGSGYGNQAGYTNTQIGQSNAGRSQQGHLGGVNHYMGH